MIGTLISKFMEKLWDTDINNLTVSHLENKACNAKSNSSALVTFV